MLLRKTCAGYPICAESLEGLGEARAGNQIYVLLSPGYVNRARIARLDFCIALLLKE